MTMNKLEHFDNGVVVRQDDDGYKFTADSISLAKFANIKHTDHVCEFCAGSGVISLYAYSLCAFDRLYFVEIQGDMCDLIGQNIALSGLGESATVLHKDVKDVCDGDFDKKVDVVLCNPPYQKVTGAKINENYEIAICRHELLCTFSDLARKASEILKYKGRFYYMLPAERLAESVVECARYGLEPKRVCAIYNNKPTAYLVLVEAVLGAKSGMILTKI